VLEIWTWKVEVNEENVMNKFQKFEVVRVKAHTVMIHVKHINHITFIFSLSFVLYFEIFLQLNGIVYLVPLHVRKICTLLDIRIWLIF